MGNRTASEQTLRQLAQIERDEYRKGGALLWGLAAGALLATAVIGVGVFQLFSLSENFRVAVPKEELQKLAVAQAAVLTQREPATATPAAAAAAVNGETPKAALPGVADHREEPVQMATPEPTPPAEQDASASGPEENSEEIQWIEPEH